MAFQSLDIKIIEFFKKISLSFARFSLFLVFFWFGILKVLDLSPAIPLVQNLFEQTISFMSFSTFIILFGLFECLIGIFFLIRRLDRITIILLALHMITTFVPLFILPAVTWSGFLVPTMEGQYIIKNLLLITTAIFIFSNSQNSVYNSKNFS